MIEQSTSPSAPPIRWHIVTGKGGVGKTTVASALALALADAGKKVLLAEIEGRQALARVLDTAPLGYGEEKILIGKTGGAVHGIAVDAETALIDYLEIFYSMGKAARGLRRLGAIDFATTIAPGVRDVLLIGKITEALRRRDNAGEYIYDAVVLDAPPTGRVARVLGAAHEVAQLVKIGPLKRHGELVTSMLADPSTALHLVTLLEDMPVRETIESVPELRSLGIAFGSVIGNRTSPVPLPAGRITQVDIARALDAAGLPTSRTMLASLAEQTRGHRQRQDNETEHRASLETLGLPYVELPQLFGGINRAAVRELGTRLGDFA
ncbi:MAG: ArsA family ATPase [Corynebacteriales bacterium]|nr:ArsA family ATPase [Mycobacteriales bacterium]